ncbi:hypothetical protein QGW_3935 [Clostridioides difficile 824]|nr:hypothetical protein QCI_0893 [Clostridioides difficile CD44]EQF86187.1 hypothetical protein QGW_3935 [Clostridioides difficile 824]
MTLRWFLRFCKKHKKMPTPRFYAECVAYMEECRQRGLEL